VADVAQEAGPVVVDAAVDVLSLSSPVLFHVEKIFALGLAEQVSTGEMGSVIETTEQSVRLI
jgi:hypothetical protein